MKVSPGPHQGVSAEERGKKRAALAPPTPLITGQPGKLEAPQKQHDRWDSSVGDPSPPPSPRPLPSLPPGRPVNQLPGTGGKALA